MYQRILNSLQDFFGISRKEARGALVMMAVCVIMIWLPVIFRRWILPVVPAGNPPEMKVLDSIATLLKKQQKYNAGKRSFTRNETPPAAPRQIKLADFDPNIASEQALMGVGIPAFIAGRIVRFRDKGGQFRRKEDLLKIYDFPADLYKRLEKHIVIRPVAQQDGGIKENAFQSSTNALSAKNAKESQRTFDINQCDTTALIRLKGIGSKLALRIVKFRDGLGGFYSMDQFNEVYGLDSVALGELRQYAKVSSPVKKIQINTASTEELGRHPYFRNRKQVQVLINYRNEHGPFRSLEALKNVKVLDEVTIQKTGPYLSF